MKIFNISHLRNWPIQRKLLLILMSAIVVTLMLVMAGIVSYEITTYRSRLIKEVNEEGMFLADNIAPALAFDDAKTAQKILNTLRASPAISFAVVYTTDGRVFAFYVRAGHPLIPLPKPGPEGLRTMGRYIELVRSIKEKGFPLGTLYLRADMVGVYARLRSYAGILIVVALALVGGAFFLQILLQRLVSEPLLQLSHMARRIAGGDLKVSVPEYSGDEIGQLARALNHMTAELAHSYAELQRTIGRLQAANRELEAFSYSVSHDLRAPLRHITGFVDLFTKRAGQGLDEQGRHYLEVITDSAGKMGNLIDDLLAFSRAGRIEMKSQPIDFNAVVSEVIRDFSMEAQGRDVEWRIQSLPAVMGDAALLRQVWVNLISNALKFTRQRKRAIIEIGSRDEESKQIYFVKDNGVGFDMKYKGKLFGLFQRLHRPEEFEGTGVGLANVQRIIHRHGGSVWAESVIGEGATFYFSLHHEGGLRHDRAKTDSAG